MNTRLVVPVSENKGIDAFLSQHFGRAPFFAVVDLDEAGNVVGQKPVAWWKVWLAIVGLLTPSVIVAIIGLLLMLFGGIGVFVLGLSAILFIIGLIISIYIFRQAAQAGET